ncbi:MAG: hypothetical protein COA42_10610 [Alteromonadaceae bacterium]|nr:MAG: hypothetical protein COA42_10610 [Alteromonadaceae bacterium]
MVFRYSVLSTFLSFALLLGAPLASLPANAFANTAHNESRIQHDYQNESGKSRAAQQAKSKHGGKVLSVSKKTDDGHTTYRVKLLLDSGRVKVVSIGQ